ncbi:MAG: PAS domain S-box protein [Clostridiaceae bacterium]|nr:PAS domain S-box protein [Clostridiaceae bacterium]
MRYKDTNTYMELFDDALIGIFHSTFDGKFIYVNKAFATILKYNSPEEVLLSIKNIEEQIFVKKYNRQIILDQLKKEGKLSNYEIQYYCKDGNIVTTLLNMQIRKDASGKDLYIEGFISNVTSLKKKEEKLKMSQRIQQDLNEELATVLQQLTVNEEILRNNYDQLKEKEAALLYQKKSFECLFNNSPDAIAHFDENERIIDVNPEFIQLFSYTYEELKDKHINDIIDPFKKMENYLTFADLTEGDYQLHDTVRYDKYGNPIEVFARGVPIVINNKTVGGYAIYTDARIIKQAEEQIRKQQKILESLFKYSPDAIVHLDMNHIIQNINRTFTDIFGYTANECIGRPLDELIINKELFEESQMINNLALQNKELGIDTVRRKKDGTLVDVCIRGGPTIVDGEIIGYHGIYTDTTARKEAEEKIKYLSYHDNLTGLYNRAFFEEEFKRLDTQRQLPLSIIIGDINGLKLTNDVFGHLVGDKLLSNTAEILKKACRKEDIICRWGGDEFAILLPKTDKQVVNNICERIFSLCKQSADTPIHISISLGYAIKQSKCQSMTDVIKEAEEQMYRNKLLESKSTRSHIIDSLQKSLHERSQETEAHAQRMKELSITLGRSLNLDNDQINELSLLAVLHDIGKIAVSDAILQKPGKLTAEEWEEMKRHSEVGYRIAETSPELIHIAKHILFHHERWDGTGYPHGLKGDEIPILSRIIAVVDAYDVMTHARVYKNPISHKEALEEILRCSGSQFDPVIVNKFIEIFQ